MSRLEYILLIVSHNQLKKIMSSFVIFGLKEAIHSLVASSHLVGQYQ